MPNPLAKNPLEDSIRGMRVIAIALLLGPVMFLFIAKFIGPVDAFGIDPAGADPNAPDPASTERDALDIGQLLPLIASALGLLSLPISLLMRYRSSKLCIGAMKAGDYKQAGDNLRQGLILFYALLEGPMLFCAVVTLLTGDLIPHGIVFAVLLAVGIALLPRASQFKVDQEW